MLTSNVLTRNIHSVKRLEMRFSDSDSGATVRDFHPAFP